jgi:hypothetical protein
MQRQLDLMEENVQFINIKTEENRRGGTTVTATDRVLRRCNWLKWSWV